MSIPVVTTYKELGELPHEVSQALLNETPYKRFAGNKDNAPGGWLSDDKTVSVLRSYIGPHVILGPRVVVEYSNLNGRIQAHGTQDVASLIRGCVITGDHVFMGPTCLIDVTLENDGPTRFQVEQTPARERLQVALTAPSAAGETHWL